MTWVRSNIKRASWIALLAMVLQFGLSFGHCHAIASAAPSVVSTPAGQQPSPSNDTDKHSGDICAICTIIAMANAMSFAAPPALPLPQIGKFSRLTADSEFARVASARVAFQPRAPPIS
jgi:hypothetical protein